MSYKSVSIVYYQDISPTFLVGRSSLIPYRYNHESNLLEFLLGYKRENLTGMTDFGGGCKIGKGENSKICLKREVKEELDYMIDDLDNAISFIVQTKPSIKPSLITFWKYENLEELIPNHITEEIRAFTIIDEFQLGKLAEGPCGKIDPSFCGLIKLIIRNKGFDYLPID